LEALLHSDPLTAAGTAKRRHMHSRNERGEGKLGGLIALALILGAAYAAWNVAPAYMDHYDFVDKINEICRTPKYKAPDDDKIIDMLMKEVRNRRLDAWIGRNSFRVSTVDTGRRITLSYEREVQLLPGMKKKLSFNFTADQPLI
jgi:hypothetical protein